jgi:hypothetical protein
MLTREEWQDYRDGAGLKKGYIKASIGDLIDRWRTLSLMEGTGPRVVLTTIRALRKKLKPLGSIAKADVLAASKALYVAAAEYEDKFAKEKNLTVVAQHYRVGHEARSIPYYSYTAYSYGLDDAPNPNKRLISALTGLRNNMLDSLRRLGGDAAVNDLVKSYPAAKGHIDSHKDTRDPLPTRDEWKAHRDGAGIPQGWVKGASIGETLTAFKAAVGDLSHGLLHALEEIPDNRMKPVQTAAFQLYLAAAKYAMKLKKEKKNTGKGQNVAEDLKVMEDVAMKTLFELDFREQLLHDIERALAEFAEGG